jgi:hypothetical protein
MKTKWMLIGIAWALSVGNSSFAAPVKESPPEIIRAFAENQLRFQRDFGDQELELSGVFAQLRPQGNQWELLSTTDGAEVACTLSVAEAQQYIEMKRGQSLRIRGRIQTVRATEAETILLLERCDIQAQRQPAVANFEMEGRWRGCNLRIGKRTYNGQTCSLYLTIRETREELQISDLRSSRGRPVQAQNADFVQGVLLEWESVEQQTGEVTRYQCEFKESTPNEFRCEWESQRRDGLIRFQRL